MSVTNVFVVVMRVYMFVSLCSFQPNQEVPEVMKIKQKFKYSHSHDRFFRQYQLDIWES